MKLRNMNSIRLVYAALLAVSAPYVFGLYLNVGILPMIPVLILAASIQALALAKSMSRGILKIVCDILHSLIYVCGAVILFLAIIVIPFPLYAAWTTFVKQGSPSGAISFLFVIGVAYFSSLIGGLVFRYGYVRPSSGLLFVVCFLATIVLQDVALCCATIVMFIVNASLIVLFAWKFSFKSLFTIVPLILVSIIVSFLLSLSNQDKRGFLSYYSLTPTFRNAIESTFPDLGFFSSLSGYGFEDQSNRLGGRFYPNRHPIMEIEAEPGRLVYLKMRTFDTYTGENWEISDSLVEKTKSDYVSMISQSCAPGLRITTLLDYSRFIPYPLDTTMIAAAPGPLPDLESGSVDTGFQLKLPILKGTVLSICEGSRPVTVKSLPETYLDIPVFLPKSVKNLAQELSAQSHTTPKTIERIIRYLDATCEYSLSATYPEQGDDFVEDFLFLKRKGYCAHFATSAAVLLRLCRIPSRYVTGYLVSMPVGKGKTLCSGLSQHAWVEAFVEGDGWRTVEATPPMSPAHISDPEYLSRFNKDNDPLTRLQLERLLSQETDIKSGGSGDDKFLPLVSMAVITGLGVGCIILIFLRKRKTKKKIVYRGFAKQIRNTLIKFVKAQARFRIPGPENIGWPSWLDEWQKDRSAGRRHCLRLLSIINKTFFSPYKLRKLDVRYVRAFYRSIGLRK